MTDHELELLQLLRFKGRATTRELSACTGLSEAATAFELTELATVGLVVQIGSGYGLAPIGRQRLEELLETERAAVDSTEVTNLYADFIPVNSDFKRLAAEWQLKDGAINDHRDSAYDEALLRRLPGIHSRVLSVLQRFGELSPRLNRYARRLSAARDHVDAGDHTWLLKPLIDSYHTVWFELHEELLELAGLTRHEEAAAGRAD